jgi:restriction endonuclease S subunit
MILNFYTSNITLSDVSKDMYGRMDVDYFAIQSKYDLESMDKLRNYITFLESGKAIKAADYDVGTENVHVTVRNIDDFRLSLEEPIYINDDKADKLADFRLKKDDVVIAISSNCGSSFVYDEEVPLNLTLSHYLCRIRVDKKRLLEKYLVIYMQSKLCKDYFRSVETGKTIKNLAQNYISDMPIYVPDIIEQKRIIDKVEPILDKIFALKKSVESKRSIIDAVFKEYFGYDYDKFESLKTMTYYSSYSQYGNNIDTRFSAKFHRPAGEFVYQELNSRPNKKIKKLLILPMITGQGIATTDYDENGDYAYVSMADISSWSLNLNDIKYVSNDYAKKKLTKKIKGNKTPISTEIGLNDILLMRSGEGGIGKVAIVEDDAKGIFCDFIIRMRFDENQMNPLFAYYYFCTRYFQYLVEINKKGLGNNTNIFPNQIQEFPIPYISLNEQKLIVDSINAELEKQKVIDKKIMKEREKIEKILAAVIA